MVKKSENVRMTLNQKATALNKEKQDFQKKYENGAFLSQDRAQKEYNRLAKMEQDLQELSNKLQNGLMEANNKNSLLFRDSINAFLKEYNKNHGYSLIFSNTGFEMFIRDRNGTDRFSPFRYQHFYRTRMGRRKRRSCTFQPVGTGCRTMGAQP